MATLESLEFAMNKEPRCPCVLLLDVSGSMQNDPINALNEGLRTLKTELVQDPIASLRVEVAVVAFHDNAEVVQEFVTVDEFDPPMLEAGGLTHMSEGINTALDMIQERKETYRRNGIQYFRPWVFMITDGEPQGEYEHVVEQAARRVKEYVRDGRVLFIGVGVRKANMTRLSEMTGGTPPLKLDGIKFNELFRWLSNSMEQIANQNPEEPEQLEIRQTDYFTIDVSARD